MRYLRSLLFAPAVRPEMFSKLPERGADAVILDLEDAVPVARKDEARATVRMEAPRLVESGLAVMVRINAADTPWCADDIGTGLDPGLAAVVLPKVETVAGLELAVQALDAAGLGGLPIVAGLETALGVVDARDLLAHPRVQGAYFGAEDFIADLGGVRTDGNAEVAHARAAMALAGRLGGAVLFDQVVTRFDDDERFTTEATEARNLGYAGKMCIHPRQVPLANAAFSPDPESVLHAIRLIDAYDAGVAAGRAAIDFEGHMVDGPLAEQARRVVDAARHHRIAPAEEAP